MLETFLKACLVLFLPHTHIYTHTQNKAFYSCKLCRDCHLNSKRVNHTNDAKWSGNEWQMAWLEQSKGKKMRQIHTRRIGVEGMNSRFVFTPSSSSSLRIMEQNFFFSKKIQDNKLDLIVSYCCKLTWEASSNVVRKGKWRGGLSMPATFQCQAIVIVVEIIHVETVYWWQCMIAKSRDGILPVISQKSCIPALESKTSSSTCDTSRVHSLYYLWV